LETDRYRFVRRSSLAHTYGQRRPLWADVKVVQSFILKLVIQQTH